MKSRNFGSEEGAGGAPPKSVNGTHDCVINVDDNNRHSKQSEHDNNAHSLPEMFHGDVQRWSVRENAVCAAHHVEEIRVQ